MNFNLFLIGSDFFFDLIALKTFFPQVQYNQSCLICGYCF